LAAAGLDLKKRRTRNGRFIGQNCSGDGLRICTDDARFCPQMDGILVRYRRLQALGTPLRAEPLEPVVLWPSPSDRVRFERLWQGVGKRGKRPGTGTQVGRPRQRMRSGR
jgi:hypothetical protein